jgi:DNA-binding response OmpR family regulator
MKILIIEDDTKIIKVLGFALRIVWSAVDIVSAAWGKEGIELVEKEFPDIIILDMGLPDMDGLDVIKQIRLFSQIPILVLTVDANETTVVQALELGANEYVTKPFRQMELVARIKNLIRFSKNIESGESFIWGPFLFDYSRHEIVRNNEVISLTGIESEILRALINNSPNVVSYNTIANIIWGDYYDGATNSLKVHIRHLREKIESNPSNPSIILSKIGVGYYAIKPAN